MPSPFTIDQIRYTGATPPTSEDEIDDVEGHIHQHRDHQMTYSNANVRTSTTSINDSNVGYCNTDRTFIFLTLNSSTNSSTLPSDRTQRSRFQIDVVFNQTTIAYTRTLPLITRIQNRSNESGTNNNSNKPHRQNSIGMTDSEPSSETE